MKTVAIHQPNYFPWLGFFFKIHAANVFVFHDNVEHSKRYPTRRTRIRLAGNQVETTWLTVPLRRHSDHALIKDLMVDHSQAWAARHLRKLAASYGKAPFFPDFFPKVEVALAEARQFERLADLNIHLISTVMRWLGTERETHRSSELPAFGKGSSYNLALVQHLGGTAYLSGAGARAYQSDSAFSKANISVMCSTFRQHYEEKQPSMAHNCSILDALFHLGGQEVAGLLRTCTATPSP